MRTLVWHLALSLGWCAVTGELSLANLVLGLVVGFLVLRVPLTPLERNGGRPDSRHPDGRETGARYFRKLRRALEFVGFFAYEVMRSALRVAYDVLTREHHLRPAVLAVPLDARTEAEITLFANLVSLTPGSLSLLLSRDGRTLYVHFMFVDDPEATVARVKEELERRVMELMR